MPYTALKGVRLRADFLLFLLSDSKFGDESGARYIANVKNFKIGLRKNISPPPPPGHGKGDDWYIWFILKQLENLDSPLFYQKGMKPAYFRITTKLALKNATCVEELSLIREPESRLYTELIRAEYEVRVREDHSTGKEIYDVDDLRLIFLVSKKGINILKIRFKPLTSDFHARGKTIFRFEDLMFNTRECMKKINDLMES
jgi:hypothetical protein